MPVSQNHTLLTPLSLLEVSIGSRRFGIRLEDVKELIQPATVSYVPKTHPFTKGVFRLRDSVYPLIDLPAFFNETSLLSEAEKEDCKFVLVNQDNHIAGLFVHAIHDIALIEESDFLRDEKLTDEEAAISYGFAQTQDQKLLIINTPLLIQYIKTLNQEIL